MPLLTSWKTLKLTPSCLSFAIFKMDLCEDEMIYTEHTTWFCQAQTKPLARSIIKIHMQRIKLIWHIFIS